MKLAGVKQRIRKWNEGSTSVPILLHPLSLFLSLNLLNYIRISALLWTIPRILGSTIYIHIYSLIYMLDKLFIYLKYSCLIIITNIDYTKCCNQYSYYIWFIHYPCALFCPRYIYERYMIWYNLHMHMSLIALMC